METAYAELTVRYFPEALNRTIVGWKLFHLGRAPGHQKPPLNRTIVGWKLGFAGPPNSVLQPFKSHHSGMETAGRSRYWR